MTFAILQYGLAGVATVGDDEILDAARYTVLRTKQLIEPSAAVTLAALHACRIPGDGPVLILLSGGNVDPLTIF
ncbi:hypothetical protein ASE16_02395 [Leifsonia sp. Root227]|nr:hypothetical protein ASE16_02395 [Leifsonia sp. Root227]